MYANNTQEIALNSIVSLSLFFLRQSKNMKINFISGIDPDFHSKTRLHFELNLACVMHVREDNSIRAINIQGHREHSLCALLIVVTLREAVIKAHLTLV